MTRWLFVSALLLLGVGTIPANANGRRTYYSTCYTPTYYYPSYSYAPAYVAPTYTAPAYTPPAYSSDWKSEVIKYAEKRDDLALYAKTLQALGINYATPNIAHEVAYPAQAQTLYGYSYSTVKEAYGALDVNQLFQTQARLAAGTKEAMAEANAAFASNVGAVSDAQARVAEILAKGKAVEASLIAANAQPTAKQTTTTTVLQPQTVIQPQMVANTNDPSTNDFMRTIAIPACSSCHSGPQAKAKFDIATYPSLTPAQKMTVLERLTTTDLSKRMPRLADGKPGTLSAEGIKGFATH